MTGNEKVTALALSFPSLRKAEGLEPFDAVALLRWACDGKSHGEFVSAAFVLSVWNPDTDWSEVAREEGIEVGTEAKGGTLARFDLHEALRVWDDGNRSAFLRWASSPWYP
jgi:hypothetical protein